jgi:imidazolonepropionase-like amidohydrolase
MGSEPSDGNQPPRGTSPRSIYYRRPTTRMGVEWVLRNAFHQARVGAGATSANGPSPDEQVLRGVLAGEIPLSLQAWTTQDIRTAVFLKEEFGIPRLFVDAAAEAWKEPELLVRSGTGVVLPPWDFGGRTGDGAFYALDTAAKLHALGVPVALSGHGRANPAYRLARQPGYAMRGGLPFEAALAAVTIVPARLAGVDDRVGSIEVGKDADLVLWSGTPFEPTSRIVAVFVNGKLLVDHRQSN